MIFATKNNPNGPAINKPETHSIDLSGTVLSFSMPEGNSYDKPNPLGTILDTVNIYERSVSSDKNSDSTVLADRWFSYKGFLGEKLGSVNLMLRLYHLDKGKLNLFNNSDFTSYLDQYHKTHFEQWNEGADEFGQILPPASYENFDNNSIKFSHYNINEQQSTILRSLYATPISDNCYIEFMFRYIGVRDTEAAWLKMANTLENNILSSVNIKLTDSEKSAMATAFESTGND